jgi:uncharacterized delta-60 repeat protein
MWPFSPRTTRLSKPARGVPPSRQPRLEALEDRCLLSSGALDPTFGSGGIVTTSLSKGDAEAHGALLQANGDIIAYGSAGIFQGNDEYSGFGLARYTPNGSLDTTFGSKGVVTTFKVGTTNLQQDGYPPSSGAGVLQAALQSDGKIVAVGSNVLLRYNSNGSLDTTFDSKGLVTPPSGFSVDSVLVQPSNGDTVVGGSYNSDFALLRYTPTGTLDSTFGSGGEVVTSSAGGNVVALALENGDIVAGGGGTLARYTLNGSLDATFGSGGIVTTALGISNLLVQPNGEIVAVGNGTGSNGRGAWALARYNVNGSLDSTFGSGGIAISSPTGWDTATASALQSNGQIVVVGWSVYNPVGVDNVFEVGVYNPNGSPDTSFGSGGFVITSWFNPDGDEGAGVVIQTDGKIVTTGTVFIGGTGDQNDRFRLARFGPSAAQIGSFTASPNPVTAGSTTTLTASNITLADPSGTITQVAFYVQVNGTNTLLGYGTQTSPGVWTFTFTVNLTPGTYTLFAQAEDSDGVFSDPLALLLQVQ